MASSGGRHVFLFLLVVVQVFSGVEPFATSVAPEDFITKHFPGLHNPGQYRPSAPREHFRANTVEGLLPNFYEPPKHENGKPNFTEDDLTALIGSDFEMPYPLYKEIMESFLSSPNVLVLLPNNTVVQVSGYAGLTDIIESDGQDIKVIISSRTMIPASVFLHIVVVQPEEVMIQLPDGQILPHQIFLERYSKKLETSNVGGQTYYPTVQPRDEFPFFINHGNHPEESLPLSNGYHNNRGHYDQRPPEGHSSGYPTGYTELPYRSSLIFESPPVTPKPVSPVPEQIPITYTNLAPVSHRPTPAPHLTPVTHPTSVTHPTPVTRTTPVTHQTPSPHPETNYQRPTPYPVSKPCSVHHSEPDVGEPRTDADQKALLPSGIHFMDNKRCHICDPSTQGPDLKIFPV